MSLNKAHAIVLVDSENNKVIGCTIYKTYVKAISELIKIIKDSDEELDIKHIRNFVKNNDASYNEDEDLAGGNWKYSIIDIETD